MNQTVRIGVVGLGSAGSLHARALIEGRVPGAVLSAVVSRPSRLADAAFLPADVRRFDALTDLLASRAHCCDALIIATPHTQHPEQTIAALSAGLHVFCEKPAGIRAHEARAMTEAAQRSGRIYSLNFNRRSAPLYSEIRAQIADGRIGALRRLHWTSTSWLRVQSYYDSSPWRGTWAGEGGGILLNQWPHILDLWQWIFGMPSRLRGHCGFGKHHAIEVEDEVNVFAEYDGGATAVLVGGTGESPGTERLEIIGDRGRLLFEGGVLRVSRMESGTVDEFIASAPAGFPNPRMREETMVLDIEGDFIAGITTNFVRAVAANDSRLLLAPGKDGEASLMLANAILQSAWQDGAWVSLPMNASQEAEFERSLEDRIANSRLHISASPVASEVFHLEDSFRV